MNPQDDLTLEQMRGHLVELWIAHRVQQGMDAEYAEFEFFDWLRTEQG